MARVVSLSEAGSIAIHGMVLIAKADKPVNVIQLSERMGASRHHVAKVLQRLAKAGLLSSARGPLGGFSLAKEPGEVNLLQIYESIEGSIEIHQCPLDKPICPFDKCIMSNVASRMTKEFRDYLQNSMLADFI